MNTPEEIRPHLTDAYNQQDWPRTYRLAEQMLSFHPDLAEARYAAGVAALQMRHIGPALAHLERAARLEPARPGFGAQYARALQAARLSRDAKIEADRITPLARADAALLDMLGGIYSDLGDHRSATENYRSAVNLAPHHPGYRYNLATALIALGEGDAAEREIETCLDAEPRFWRAHLSLSHLRTQTSTNNHLPRLEYALQESKAEPMARLCLNMALAKEYEDLGRYPEAFAHLAEGKATARESVVYDQDQEKAMFGAFERAFPTPITTRPEGNTSNEPIFIFGMPRSGTTLVERILTSHPDVTMAGELLDFGIALRRAWGSKTPIWQDEDIARRAAELDWAGIGASYLQFARPHGDHSHFVDKFPFNFLHAGFIARALPNARMICLRRNPMDTCIGNYRQLFAEKLPYYHYSFDLLDIGRYYIQFDRLMSHWMHVIPGHILEVGYEDLVVDQEGVTRRILDFCNLPWNDACLHFERNEAPVSTASALQVRHPIYQSAVGQWKRYQVQLDPLRQLLIDAGISVD